MKQIVPLVTILLLTSTLSLTACGKAKQQSSEEAIAPPKVTPSQEADAENISDIRVGPRGEYHQSGLAKRVSEAFAQDPELAGISTIYVAQTESTIILKGTVPNQTILDKMVSVAETVKGITGIQTSQVKVKNP